MNVEQAEREIAKILSQLERSFGLVVNDVEIETFDVSNLDESGRRYMKSIKIVYHPAHANVWRQAMD